MVPALVLAAVWLVFFSIGTSKNEKDSDYRGEAIQMGKIDENILNGIKDMEYSKVKETLNATGDFCLVVVDGQNSVLLEKHPGGKTQAELCDGMV